MENAMEELLLKLLVRLESIEKEHEEITDTVCRDAMRKTVFLSFLRPEPDYQFPDDYGLYDAEANLAVKAAIVDYVTAVQALAPSLGITNFQQRLAAFQNVSVYTEDGTTYDEFFGYQVPSRYDLDGNWLDPN